MLVSKINFCELSEVSLEIPSNEASENSLTNMISNLISKNDKNSFKESNFCKLIKEYLDEKNQKIFIATIMLDVEFLEQIKATLDLSEKLKLLKSEITKIKPVSQIKRNLFDSNTKLLGQALHKRYGHRSITKRSPEIKRLREDLNMVNVSDVKEIIRTNNKLKKSLIFLSGKEITENDQESSKVYETETENSIKQVDN